MQFLHVLPKNSFGFINFLQKYGRPLSLKYYAAVLIDVFQIYFQCGVYFLSYVYFYWED